MPATREQLDSALLLATKYVTAVSTSLQALCDRPTGHFLVPDWPGAGDIGLNSATCWPLETDACVSDSLAQRVAPPVIALPFLVDALAETKRLLDAVRKQLPPLAD